MTIINKEDLLKELIELDEERDGYARTSSIWNKKANTVTAEMDGLLEEYCSQNATLLPGKDCIKNKAGILLVVDKRYSRFVKPRDKPFRIKINYTATYEHHYEYFTEEDLQENLANGDWTIVGKDAPKLPKSITINHIRELKASKFLIGTTKFFAVIRLRNHFRNQLTSRIARDNPEGGRFKWLLKLKKSRYTGDLRYYLYIYDKNTGKATKDYKHGEAEIIKISQNKEDLLEELL